MRDANELGVGHALNRQVRHRVERRPRSVATPSPKSSSVCASSTENVPLRSAAQRRRDGPRFRPPTEVARERAHVGAAAAGDRARARRRPRARATRHSCTTTRTGASSSGAPRRAAAYARTPSTLFAEYAGGSCSIAPVSCSTPRAIAASSGRSARRTTTPVDVVGVRLVAEANRRLVDLRLAVDVRNEPRRAAEQHDEQPGGERIERAGVSDARVAPVARRTTATTSCEVMPAGLSTSASPLTSVVRVSIGRGGASFRP